MGEVIEVDQPVTVSQHRKPLGAGLGICAGDQQHFAGARQRQQAGGQAAQPTFTGIERDFEGAAGSGWPGGLERCGPGLI